METVTRRLRQLIDELDELRLANDWTFDDLATATACADAAMTARSLYYLIKSMPPSGRPLDRTIYKLEKFLAFAAATGGDQMRALVKQRKTAAA